MKDAERRLFRCMSGIDDELVLEAATLRFQPKRWGHLAALAACLVLVLAIPVFLSSNKGGPEAGSDREQAEAPESSNNKFAENEGIGGTDAEIPAGEPNYAAAEILKTESIGGLYLGMPDEEVTDLLGEAWNNWAEPFTGNDGFPRLRWFFDSGEPNKKSDYDLVLEMIDLGSGWILNHITVNAGCSLPLSRQNISIGSTLDAVAFAYADGGVTTLKEGTTANGGTWAYYAVGGNWTPGDTSWSGLLFTLYNDKVTFITYGPLVIDDGVVPMSLGHVALGMTKPEIQVLLGEPNSMVDGGGYSEWKYDTLTITFHDFNQTVWTIQAREGCQLKLPTGIGIGSSEDAVKEAYPDAMLGTSTPSEDGTPDTYYHLDGLTIGLSGGNVCEIQLYCTTDPMLDALTVNEITVYRYTGKLWETTTVIDKAAKGICTVLTISEPEDGESPESAADCWLDFGNGTAVRLSGGDFATVYTYDTAFDPDHPETMTLHLGGVFPDLDRYVAAALEDPTAGWD